MKLTEQDELVKRTLRIPRSLYEEIQNSAEVHVVSVNAEIVDRLHAASVRDQFAKLSKEMAEMKKMLKELLDKS